MMKCVEEVSVKEKGGKKSMDSNFYKDAAWGTGVLRYRPTIISTKHCTLTVPVSEKSSLQLAGYHPDALYSCSKWRTQENAHGSSFWGTGVWRYRPPFPPVRVGGVRK